MKNQNTVIRKQTTKMRDLLTEYNALKSKLFQNNTFVVLDYADPNVARYNQLFQFFYPQYRTSGFVNPL